VDDGAGLGRDVGRRVLGQLEIERETIMLKDPASEALEVDGRHALRIAIKMEPAADMKRIVGELAPKDGAPASRASEL
jgi:hypothetical protein